jgi:hypothetical protein
MTLESTSDPTAGGATPSPIPPPSQPSCARLWLTFLLLAAGIFATRLPIATLLRTGIPRDDDDEMQLTLTAVDHLLGTSVRELHWSGATNQALLLPLVMVDAAVHTRLRLTPANFVAYLSGVYREPWHVLWLARLQVAALASLGIASLLFPLARRLRSVTVAAGLVAFLALVPEVWRYTAQATANGLATALACLAFTVALGGERERPLSARRLGWTGALLGLCLAARLVFVPVVPLLLVLCARRSGGVRGGARAMAAISLWAAVGFLLACPFVWTDPVRFAKAVAGNYLKHGTPVGWRGALCAYNQAVPPLLSASFVVAVILGVRCRHWGVIVGALVSVGMLLASSVRSPMVEPRYFLSTAIVLVVATGLLLPRLPWWVSGGGGPWWKSPARLVPAIGAALAVTACLWHGHVVWAQRRTWVRESAAALAAADAVRALPADGGVVAVGEGLVGLVQGAASSDALAAMALQMEAAISTGGRAVEFARGFGFDPRVVRALLHDFDEKERSNAARFRAAAGADGRPGLNLTLYGETYGREGFCSTAEAIERWRRGQIQTLVLESPPPADLTPAQVFAAPAAEQKFYLLRHEGMAAAAATRPAAP